MKWDQCQLYGFSFQMPQRWLLRFSKNFYYEHGNLDIVEPSEKRQAVVTILWRPYNLLLRKHSEPARAKKNSSKSFLCKAKNYLNSQVGMENALSETELQKITNLNDPDVVKHTLKSYRNQVINSLSQNFKDLQIHSSCESTINGHYSIKDNISLKIIGGIFKRRGKVEIFRRQNLYVCTDTGRLFAIYASTSIELRQEYLETFNVILKSFKCHQGISKEGYSGSNSVSAL